MMDCRYKSWSDVNIGLYYRMREILEAKGADELEKEAKMIALLFNKEEEEVWNLPVTKLSDYKACIGWIGQPLYYDDYKPSKRLKIGNRLYDLVIDANKMTYAQYVDFQTLYDTKDCEGKLMSVICVPQGKKYNDGYNINEEIKYIEENCSIKIYYSILRFFFHRSLTFIKRSQQYLTVAMKLMSRTEKVKHRVQKAVNRVTHIWR